jgi:hypothetical protein
MPFDQRPVDHVTAAAGGGAFAEQLVDVRVDHVFPGAEEDQVREVADAWHQVEPEQGREGEYRRRLALGVGVHGGRLDVRLIRQQALDQVHRL